ncbi:replication initiation protein [Apilactobacillus timberlakei]|uniref:replication initiation protein n=1 Tax=Apilactobacillus timberlakei TaxID=2008380 RepID=UPI00112B213F|nr:replication initiation protein [Apilactobacillus timberlakei]TPR15009.1 replication initiation protein [Apilactobacillus timberlakei]
MANEIVKFNNELNTIPLKNFNKQELNIFFSIISQMRDKGSDTVTFTIPYLMDLAKPSRSGSYFNKELKKTYDKILNLTVWREDAKSYEKWILFDYYKIDNINNTISVSINPRLKGILNDLEQWTRFSLMQFVGLKSTYSKNLFRILKQYRTVGKKKIKIDAFRTLLDVPKSYNNSSISQRVINPIRLELSGYFRGFNIKSIKDTKHKNKLIGYEMTWHPESKNSDDFSLGFERDTKRRLDNLILNIDIPRENKIKYIDKILKENKVYRNDEEKFVNAHIQALKMLNEHSK